MSMNDTEIAMRQFVQQLEQFNNNVRTSFQDLKNNHEKVSPLWQDSMRQTYDAQWREFDEMMKRYLQQQGPQYYASLRQKLDILILYLRG